MKYWYGVFFFTWLHYMFYSLQLFLHACLVESSDLMLGVVAEIYWVVANIALVIATTLRDLEQRIEISHVDILPRRYFMIVSLQVLCSYDWSVMLTRKTIQYFMFDLIAWFYISLYLSTLYVWYKAFASLKPCTEYDHYSCIQTWTKNLPQVSIIPTYTWYFTATPSKFLVCYL